MKRCLFFILVLAALLCGCSKKDAFSKSLSGKNLKVGFIYGGKINDRGYFQAQDRGRLALERKGVRTLYVEDVPETVYCETVIKELVKQGCGIIFSTATGFDKYVLDMAQEFPEVKFAQCSGSRVANNVSCYSARSYEARYLAGIVAGLKTTANKIGYIAAFPEPEYIREINAFTLGVKSVNPDAIVNVRWTDSLYNYLEAKYRAEELIIQGCDILTQNLNCNAIHSVVQQKGAFLIDCNYPSIKEAPDSYLTSVCCNWEIFVIDEVQRYLEENWEARYYIGGIESGLVDLSELSKLCNPGTKKCVDNAKRRILSGELNVFAGPIYDMNGNMKIDEGMEINSLSLLNMDWFVEGVSFKSY